MIFLEIIIQGYNKWLGQGTAQNTNKLALKEGVNFMQTRSVDASDALLEALTALLYSPGSTMREQLKKSTEKVRGGITFKSGEDTFRLVKDLSANTLNLSQFKKEKNQFDELSRDAAFITQLLQSRCRLPDAAVWRSLFIIGGKRYRELLQHGTGKSEMSKTGQDYFGVLDESSAVPAGGGSGASSADKRARLTELKGQLKTLELVQAMELKLDELQQHAFEKEEVLSRLKDKQTQVQNTEVQFQSVLQGTQNISIPDDVKVKIEKFRRAETDKTNDLSKLDAKAEKLVREFEHTPLEPVQKNPLCLAGGIGFLLSVVGAISQPKIRVICVLGLVASIITVAVGFLKHLARQEKHRKLQQQIDQLDYEKKAIEKRYEIEMSVVLHLMKRLQLKDPEDIVAMLEERAAASAAIKKAKDELNELRKSLNIDQVQNELKALQQETEDIRKKMGRFSGTNFDPMQLRREIAQLESDLGVAASDGRSTFSSRSASVPADPLEQLLHDAAQLLKTSPEALLAKLKPGLETNLVAVSGRRLAEPVIAGGRITAVSTGKAGKQLPVLELGEQELFYVLFALQFTLLQVVTKNAVAAPVMALDLPESVGSDAMEVVFKALKHLSGTSQVVCIAAHKGWANLHPPVTL